MKHRTALPLFELVLMTLLFAITAAVCLRAFALSDRLSRQAEQRDRAVLWAQTLAEEWKALNGNIRQGNILYDKNREDSGWTAYLDENWALIGPEEETAYTAELREEPAEELLRRAQITVRESGSGRCIYVLETACQEAA